MIKQGTKKMIKQGILNFKIEGTNEEMTEKGGLIELGEFMHGLGLRKELRRHLSKPESGRGYESWEYIEPLILMLVGGGRSIEDLREIRRDSGFLEALKIKRVPSSSAVGKYLERSGERGDVEGMKEVTKRVIEKSLRALDRGKKYECTLDIDATIIKSEKREAKMSYKGFKGYAPMIGHVEVEGRSLIVNYEFREGNEAPASRNLEFIKDTVSRLPRGIEVKRLRADSATYQAGVINWCEENNIKFAIGARLDKAVKEVIMNIPAGQWKDHSKGGGVKIAEVVHTMNNTKESFTLIVVKRPVQREFDFVKEEGIKTSQEEFEERYKVVATNMVSDKVSAEDVIEWYNQRGDKSENRIKELKIDFGMERMPSGSFTANSMFFAIGVLAYNLFVLFQLLFLDEELKKARALTLRWKLFNIPARVVYHARYLILKIHYKLAKWLVEIRTRMRELFGEVSGEY